MNQEDIKGFVRRVTEANSCDLIVILYDIVLTDLASARKALATGDKKGYAADIHHAQKFVSELISVLDYKVPLSYSFLSIYTYCFKQMSYAAAGFHPEALTIVEESLSKLRSSFNEISAQDTRGPLMQNAQAVYAGLTYGPGKLNESFINASDYNRGFMA